MKRLLLILISIIYLNACSQESIKNDSGEISKEDLLENNLEQDEEVKQENDGLENNFVYDTLPVPTNIVGSYNSDERVFNISWDYDIPEWLNEDEYGELYFAITAELEYGEVYDFVYCPKTYREHEGSIEEFTESRMTGPIYVYAVQGIGAEATIMSDKSEPFYIK